MFRKNSSLLMRTTVMNLTLSFGVLAGISASSLAAPPKAAAPAKKTVPAQSTTPAQPPISDALGEKLQDLLSKSRAQLGVMEPWQKKLFEEEALPQYQRFIRDYRATAGGKGAVEAEIDFESLRKYLRFYAPKALKRENPTLLVYVKSQSDCDKCSDGAEEVKSLVKSRLERRGFHIAWISAAEIGTAVDLASALSHLAQTKKAAGTLVVEMRVAAADPGDTAHADDISYEARSMMDVRDIAHHQGSLEVLENASFSKAVAKLLTDAFTDLGEKVERVEVAQNELKREEAFLEISGVDGYAEYVAARDGVKNLLKNSAVVEEQKIARGRAVFALHSELPVAKLEAELKPLRINGARVRLTGIDGQTIRLELEPAAPGGSR